MVWILLAGVGYSADDLLGAVDLLHHAHWDVHGLRDIMLSKGRRGLGGR